MLVRLLTSASPRLRSVATRLGHDAVWLFIAVLFCVVEAAVVLSDFVVSAGRRRRHAPKAPAFGPRPRVRGPLPTETHIAGMA